MKAEVDQHVLRETVEELFEHAPCGYLSTLPDGTIIQVNQTFVSWTGHARDGLLSGTRFQDLLTIPGKIYHDTHYGPLLEMQGFVREIAFDLACPGREPLPVLVNAAQKRDSSGRPILTRVTVFDATDRRQYERELLAARKRAELAIDVERAAREESERANRVKDEFLAQVSHELRTPLNAILGWTQLLQGDELSEELKEGLDIIERNTRVQVQLVDDLLDMGRIVSGKMRLDVQQLELAGIVEEAIETARPAAEAKGVRLQKVLDPAVIVSGDPGRMQQVFWNLLSNAIKFTPRGGFVRVLMQRVNSHVEVSVIDNGQGMKPGFLEHAFERFRQSDSAGTRRTGGLGLGLSIVKNLVEMHGGAVRALSAGEGKGSTFVVNLPVTVVHAHREGGGDAPAHPRAALTEKRLMLPEISLAGVKVVVVDDESDARELLRRVLAGRDAEVVTAGSAGEGLDAVERMRPDVLISDIGMPDVDGYELIRRVRMLGEGVGRVPAVALTAFARLEDRTRAMLAGYQMHLTKPVDPQELVVTVANLTGRLSKHT
jgi:signal transduction histidine kinase/ActR/RegA family two-component response regulator